MEANRELVANRILLRELGLPPEADITREIARAEFRETIGLLGRGEAESIDIDHNLILELLLDNIDDVCELLSLQIEVGEVRIRTCEFRADQEAAWMKLLAALDSLTFHCFFVTLRNEVVMKAIVQILQTVRVSGGLILRIDYHISLSNADQAELLQALKKNKMVGKRESLFIDVNDDSYWYTEVKRSLTEGRMGEGSLFHTIFQVDDVEGICIGPVNVLEQDCRSLAALLSTEECLISGLSFSSEAQFVGNGGEHIAKAIKDNTSLGWLSFEQYFDESNFDDFKLAEVLKHNYTITQIERGDVVNGGAAGVIASLNIADREYLRTKYSVSRKHCANTLVKIKDKPSALFIHLRKNPIIFY